MPRADRLRRADPRAGFTLIEVLAALVITSAFVAVVLPYAGRLATHWWVGETTVEAADGWMQAIGRMSDDLAQAVALGLGTDDLPVISFRGGPDSIRFVRPALGRSGAAGDLETVSYEVQSSAAGYALVRRTRGFDPAAFGRDALGGAATTLLDGPYRLRLVTIDRDGTRRRNWTVPDRMPVSVELSAAAIGRQPVPVAPILMPIVARRPAVSAHGKPGSP